MHVMHFISHIGNAHDQESLSLVGFSQQDLEDLVAVLAAVLHLGNIAFVNDADDVSLEALEVCVCGCVVGSLA